MEGRGKKNRLGSEQRTGDVGLDVGKKDVKEEKWKKNRSRRLQHNTLEWPGGRGRQT